MFILCGLMTACNEAPGPAPVVETPAAFNLDSVKNAIAASNSIFEAAIRTNDSSKYISRYSSDGCINPPNMAKMCGAAGLAAFFKGAISMGIKDLKLTTEDVIGGPEIVAETGTYQLFADAGKSVEKGKFIVLWKQENGEWKMYRDEWNSDAPPTAQK